MKAGIVDPNGKNIINAFRIDHNGVLAASPVASLLPMEFHEESTAAALATAHAYECIPSIGPRVATTLR